MTLCMYVDDWAIFCYMIVCTPACTMNTEVHTVYDLYTVFNTIYDISYVV